MLEIFQVELLAANESQDPTGSADHDVGAVALQHLLVLRDGEAAEEHGALKRKNKCL